MKLITIIVCLFVFNTAALASLKISSYNIRMFDAKKEPTNKKELAKILKSLKFDFLTVSEIVNDQSFKKFIRKEFPGYRVILSKCGGGGRQKLGFIYNPMKFKLIKFYEDMRISDPDVVVGQYGCGRLRPALVGKFQDLKTNKKFVMVGVHLKAGGSERSYNIREKQYKILGQLLDELKLAQVYDIVVMGDFNTTGYNLGDIDYTRFTDMLSDARFKTSAREIECTSYWSGMNTQDDIEESSILDHIIYPKRFLGYRNVSSKISSHCAKLRCSNASSEELGISYKEVSDHCPIVTTFR